GGLVTQQQLGIRDNRTGNGDALLLSSRHLARIVSASVSDVDDLQGCLDVTAALPRAQPGEQKRQLDVLGRREHRHQVIELKNEADVGGSPTSKLALPEDVDPRTLDVDLARIRSIDTAEQIEQGGLARAGRSHDGDEIVARD